MPAYYPQVTVVGERTAGAVVAGQLFALPNGDLLYLAVRGVEVDGQVLEGRGVEPDIRVPMKLPYSAGRDPQLEEAIQHLIAVLTG